jgi:hypothetical protein
MADMALRFTTSYLTDSLDLFRYYKTLAERAMAQVSDEQLLTVLDGEANSIAVIVKHMAGNMRSRWTDFLTSDGEKPDRNRDTEFEDAQRRGTRCWRSGSRDGNVCSARWNPSQNRICSGRLPFAVKPIQ